MNGKMDYFRLWVATRDQGLRVPSRFGDIRELRGAQLTVPIGTIVGRKGANHKIGFMEGLQAIAGTYDASYIQRVTSRVGMFSPDIAFGLRLRGQIEQAVRRIQRDPDSRQVVLYNGKSDDWNTDFPPCLTTIQLLPRGGYLHAIASFRSWDLTLGAPYDITVVGMVAAVVAAHCGLIPGDLTATAGSCHIYEKNIDVAALEDFGCWRLGEASFGEGATDFHRGWATRQMKEAPWPGLLGPAGLEFRSFGGLV